MLPCELNYTELNYTELNYTELNYTELNYTELNYTERCPRRVHSGPRGRRWPR
jgi:hypothetical protein